MKKSLIIWIIVIGIVLISALAIKNSYNRLVNQDESINSSWAQVENVYQRRADLIPNLVNTVKGYAEHEKSTLTGVIEARAKATSVTIDPTNMNQAALNNFKAAQGELSSALSRLMVTIERYPDLKANQNFRDLQAQLEGTENRIAVERRKYNDAVALYNKNIRTFPTVLIAGMFGFEKRIYFEAEETSKKAPEVNFNN